MANEKEKVEQEEVKESVEETTAEEVDKTEKKDETQQKDEVNEQKMIPYWRFKEVVDEKNKLNQQLKELQNKIENMDDPEEIKKQLKEENEQLQKRNKEFLKESEVKVKAIAEGIRKEALEDFIKVVDTEKLTVDEDNNVVGVDELIADAKENKSFYFGSKDETSSKTAGDFNTDQNSDKETEEQWLDKMMNIGKNY